MPIEDAIRLDAEIVERLGGELFRARLANGHVLHVHCKSRHREKAAALNVGDRVRLELSPFDMSKGCMLFLD